MVGSDVLFDMRTATSNLLPFPMPFFMLAIAIMPIVGLIESDRQQCALRVG